MPRRFVTVTEEITFAVLSPCSTPAEFEGEPDVWATFPAKGGQPRQQTAQSTREEPCARREKWCGCPASGPRSTGK